MKKIVSLFLVMAMLLVCFGAIAEEITMPEVKEGIDFGGKTIYIYDYWTGDDSRKEEPTDEEQLQYNYRDWIMETYNCEIHQIAKGDWGSQVTELINFCGDPNAADTLCLYILPDGYVGAPMTNNLLAAWPIDPTEDPWNTEICDLYTKNGKVYGVACGKYEPRHCLFFNKRILEDAGIDWESIYDMQAEGTWTWEVFEDMLKKITKDNDSDGVNDIWGMTGSNMDMYEVAVFCNGGSFFEYDENNKLYCTANSENTMTALQWSKDIYNTYFYQQPADGQWDYYKDAWKQGFCGFYMYQTYGGFNDNSEMADMEDEWGCVMFPVGPMGTTYKFMVCENTTVIPNVYDEKTVADLAYIYQLWGSTTPGLEEDEYAWVGRKTSYTDERAVFETYAMMLDPEHVSMNYAICMDTNNNVLGQDFLWNLSWQTPAEIIEAKTPAWEGMMADYNK